MVIWYEQGMPKSGGDGGIYPGAYLGGGHGAIAPLWVARIVYLT